MLLRPIRSEMSKATERCDSLPGCNYAFWQDSEEFCFVNPDSEIAEEISDLSLQNVEITEERCETKTNVCFNGEKCDIEVSRDTVRKGTQSVKYVESTDRNDKYALLFAAIFSDPEEYSCQMQRLSARAESLAELYIKKSENLPPGDD